MASKNPLVSVITPVYNGAAYLQECVQSVLAQTYENFEYLIVDNCSTDGSFKIAKKAAATDRRINVIRCQDHVGIIQNCDFLGNHTPIEGDGDDGGAINLSGLSVLTIIDCWFDGNYACSPTGVEEDGADGDAGHIKLQGSSVSALTPGTTLIAKNCVFLNGRAEDDAGAVQANGDGVVVRLDSCWFEGNTSWDNGNVCQFPDSKQNEVTVTNCVFVNNITKSDNSPDRMIETRRNSKFINCTFVGNNQEDQDNLTAAAEFVDGVKARFPLTLTAGLWVDMEIVGEYLKTLD